MSLQCKPVAVNFSVDLIRSLAIMLVIMLHSSAFPYRFLNPVISTMDIVSWFSADVYAAFGMVGVPLFVMLTGALLLNPAKADEPLRVFYKKRWERIGLPFIFWTLTYFVWSFGVHGKPFTLFNIAQGLVEGSYSHLWYLYLLIGLYSVTPILRILVKHIDRKLFTYLLILWFAGTVITPFIHTFTELSFNPVMFVFFDWVGYFLLGIYLLKANLRRSTAYAVAILGLLGAILGDWALTAIAGEQYTGYFHNYMSYNMILGTAAIFFILISVNTGRIESHSKLNCVIHWISQNTLPIYLIHLMVIETLALGLLGFTLNALTFNPIVDVPLFTLIVFAVSAAIVYALKKIPYVKKIIG